METEFMKEPLPNTVSVANALEVASMFASERDTTSRPAMESLRVRRTIVEGTNGHILIQLPIDEQLWLTGFRFVAADAALIVGKSTDDSQQFLKTLGQDIEGFPDTDKTVATMRELPVQFECSASPVYLETIGKAFSMLGVSKVRMRCRGEMQAIEFIGHMADGHLGVAFLMPMK